MIVACPGCRTRYRIRDALLAAGGTRMQCPKCGQRFEARPPAAPPPAAPIAAPADAGDDFEREWDTQVEAEVQRDGGAPADLFTPSLDSEVLEEVMAKLIGSTSPPTAPTANRSSRAEDPTDPFSAIPLTAPASVPPPGLPAHALAGLGESPPDEGSGLELDTGERRQAPPPPPRHEPSRRAAAPSRPEPAKAQIERPRRPVRQDRAAFSGRLAIGLAVALLATAYAVWQLDLLGYHPALTRALSEATGVSSALLPPPLNLQHEAELALRQARQALERGELINATLLYRRALHYRPDSAEAREGLAKCFEELGQQRTADVIGGER